MELEIWHLWMLLSIGLFIVEIITSTFSSLCFGIGALSAGIIAYANYSSSIQLVVFIILTTLTILVLKPYLKQKLVRKSGVNIKVDENYTGKEVYVIEEVNPNKNRDMKIIGGTGKKQQHQEK